MFLPWITVFIAIFNKKNFFLLSLGTGHFTICDLCGAKVKGRGTMKTHIFLHHSEAGKNPTIPCEVCGMLFRQKESLRFHFKHVHLNGNVKPWACPYCLFTCKRKNNLRQHLRVKHKMSVEGAHEEVAKIDVTALQAKYPGVYLNWSWYSV